MIKINQKNVKNRRYPIKPNQTYINPKPRMKNPNTIIQNAIKDGYSLSPVLPRDPLDIIDQTLSVTPHTNLNSDTQQKLKEYVSSEIKEISISHNNQEYTAAYNILKNLLSKKRVMSYIKDTELIKDISDTINHNSMVNMSLHNKDFHTFNKMINLEGVDMNAPDKDDMTPLMVAARECNYQITWHLLYNGADPLKENQSGQIAIDFVVYPKTRYRDEIISDPELFNLLNATMTAKHFSQLNKTKTSLPPIICYNPFNDTQIL